VKNTGSNGIFHEILPLIVKRVAFFVYSARQPLPKSVRFTNRDSDLHVGAKQRRLM